MQEFTFAVFINGQRARWTISERGTRNQAVAVAQGRMRRYAKEFPAIRTIEIKEVR